MNLGSGATLSATRSMAPAVVGLPRARVVRKSYDRRGKSPMDGSRSRCDPAPMDMRRPSSLDEADGMSAAGAVFAGDLDGAVDAPREGVGALLGWLPLASRAAGAQRFVSTRLAACVSAAPGYRVEAVGRLAPIGVGFSNVACAAHPGS